MDEQPIHKDHQPSPDQPPSESQASVPFPDTMSPEDYLLNADDMLGRDQPESLTKNAFLFSPLLVVVGFIIISLTVISSYTSQRQQQVAEIRSRAKTAPCAAGSYPGCINPGDSCGTNRTCMSGLNTTNQFICECKGSLPIPSVAVSPSPTSQQVLNTATAAVQVAAFVVGIILLLLGLLLWRRKKRKE